MSRPTLDELRTPIPATCGRCGCRHAVILPDPAPRGRFVCPRCSLGLEHREPAPSPSLSPS